MKTLFTSDVAGATRFLEAIEFNQWDYYAGFIQGKICLKPRDNFEIKEGSGNACLITQDGCLGKLGRRLESEFRCEKLGFSKTGPISGWINYQTPFGFTIHIHVTLM